MASTYKMCVLVVLACILGPIAAGYLLPSGESMEKTGYTESNPVNITQDLYNDTVGYPVTYSGIKNNAFITGANSFAQPNYIDTSPAKGAVKTYNSTAGSTDTIATGWTQYPIPADRFTNVPTNQLMILAVQGGTIGGGILANNTPVYGNLYYEGGSAIVRDGGHNEYDLSSTTFVAHLKSGNNLNVSYYQQTGWANPDMGFSLSNSTTYHWTNYLENKTIDFVFKFQNAGWVCFEDLNNTGTLGHDTELTIRSSGSYISLNLNTSFEPEQAISKSLGKYNEALIRLDFSEENKIHIFMSGLIYSEQVSTPIAGRIVELKEFASIDIPEGQPYYGKPWRSDLTLRSGYDDSISDSYPVQIYISGTTYNGGSYSIIKDNTVNPAWYFPQENCSAELRSISQYGDSITLPGASNANLPITGGYVTVTGTENGETVSKEVKLRELTVLAVYDADTHLYSCYIDNILLGQQAAPTITLNGAWLLTAYVFKTEAYTYTTLEWDMGTFNLDVTGFCLVGLLCSFVAFVGLGLWGRRSGGKVAALAFVALLCAFVYLTILMGE